LPNPTRQRRPFSRNPHDATFVRRPTLRLRVPSAATRSPSQTAICLSRADAIRRFGDSRACRQSRERDVFAHGACRAWRQPETEGLPQTAEQRGLRSVSSRPPPHGRHRGWRALSQARELLRTKVGAKVRMPRHPANEGRSGQLPARVLGDEAHHVERARNAYPPKLGWAFSSLRSYLNKTGTNCFNAATHVADG